MTGTGRRWAVGIAALGAVVGIAVGMGQPQPASPASGVSVPVSAVITPPRWAPPMFLVSRGVVSYYDLTQGTSATQRLPRGARPRAVLGLANGSVVIVTTVGRHSIAYLMRNGHAVALGPARTAVVGVGRRGVWLVEGRLARYVTGYGRPTARRIVVPPGYAVVGAAQTGLVVSTATPLVPGRSLIVSPNVVTRQIAPGRALAVAGDQVLLKLGGGLAVLDLRTGLPQRIPWLPALIASDHAALSPDGRTFAILARAAGRTRLVVGPVDVTEARALHVVPLDGKAAGGSLAIAWISRTTVVAVRPDGRLVAYRSGDSHAWLLDGPTAVSALAGG